MRLGGASRHDRSHCEGSTRARFTSRSQIRNHCPRASSFERRGGETAMMTSLTRMNVLCTGVCEVSPPPSPGDSKGSLVHARFQRQTTSKFPSCAAAGECRRVESGSKAPSSHDVQTEQNLSLALFCSRDLISLPLSTVCSLLPHVPPFCFALSRRQRQPVFGVARPVRALSLASLLHRIVFIAPSALAPTATPIPSFYRVPNTIVSSPLHPLSTPYPRGSRRGNKTTRSQSSTCTPMSALSVPTSRLPQPP